MFTKAVLAQIVALVMFWGIVTALGVLAYHAYASRYEVATLHTQIESLEQKLAECGDRTETLQSSNDYMERNIRLLRDYYVRVQQRVPVNIKVPEDIQKLFKEIPK